MRRLAVAALVTVACSKDLGDPQTRYLEPAVAATPLTTNPAARLSPAPTGAALVAVGANDVRWASLAADGRLGAESSAPVPAHTQGPWVGLATATTFGDRVLVVWGEPAGAGVQLRATVMADGGAGAATFDLDAVPAALVASLRVSVATDPGGAGVAVLTAFEGQPGSPVNVRVLRAGAGQPSAPMPVAGLPQTWRCLSLVPSRSTFTVLAASAVPEELTADKVPFTLVELNADGNAVFIHRLSITVREPGCPVTSVTPGGYLLALQTDAGTFLADYDVAAHASPTNFVLGSVRFGGPSQQPPVASVAQLARLNLALLASASGPEVWTFDRQGTIQGGPLRLPVAAPLPATSAISAQVVAADLWVSYWDGGARRFLRVAPRLAPAEPSGDAGTRD